MTAPIARSMMVLDCMAAARSSRDSLSCAIRKASRRAGEASAANWCARSASSSENACVRGEEKVTTAELSPSRTSGIRSVLADPPPVLPASADACLRRSMVIPQDTSRSGWESSSSASPASAARKFSTPEPSRELSSKRSSSVPALPLTWCSVDETAWS
jgi:hypothetical protein